LRASISSTAFREDGSEEEVPASLVSNTNEPIQIAALFPNPTNGKLNLVFDSNAEGLVQINLIDITGRTAMSSALPVVYGRNSTLIDVTELPNGVYNVVISDGIHKSNQLIIKQ
jgi:hypothetical protein